MSGADLFLTILLLLSHTYQIVIAMKFSLSCLIDSKLSLKKVSIKSAINHCCDVKIILQWLANSLIS